MPTYRFLLLLISFFIFKNSICQEKGKIESQLIQYTIKDGLPTNEIYNSFLDSKGYLWFGSDKGAIRFNGHQFKIFDIKDGLPTNDVLGFAEDKYGRIWLATYLGKLCYYQNGVFYTEKNTPWLKLNFKANHINSITTTPKGSVLIAFANSEFTFLEIDGNFLKTISLQLDSNLNKKIKKTSNNFITAQDNYYNINFQNQFLKIDTLGRVLKTIEYPESILFNGNKSIYRLQKNYSIYTGENTKDLELLKYKDLLIDIKHVFYYFSDNNTIFLCTNKGLIIFDKKNTTLLEHLPNLIVHYISKDIEGNYWFSTNQKGIYRLNASYNLLTTLSTPSMFRSELVKNNGILYCLDKKNIMSLNIKNQTIGNILNTNIGLHFIEIGDKKLLLFSDAFESYEIKKTKSNFSLSKMKENKFSNYIEFNASDGKYLMDWGVRRKYIYIAKNKNDTIVRNMPYKAYSFDFDSKNNTLLIANPAGLHQIKDNQWENIRLKKDAIPYQVKTIGTKLLVVDQTGNLHIITNYQSKTLLKDSMFDVPYYFDKILFTNDRYFAISSGNTIFIGNPFTYTLQKIPDFMSSENIFDIHMEDDHLFIARENDIIITKTELVANSSNNIRTLIDKIIVGEKTYYTSSITLNYDEVGEIKIIIDALSYNNNKFAYEYKIFVNDESEVEWRELNTNVLTLIRPHYGKYKILLRTTDNNGNHSTPISCVINIKKPYWASFWFIIILICLISLLLYQFYKYNIKKQLQKKQLEFEVEKKIMKSEYKALNALMNPHFLFNNLNNIQSLMNHEEKNKATEYLSLFASLMRNNMYNIDDGIIPLIKEIQLIDDYVKMEKLRHGNIFEFTITVDQNIDIEEISIPPLLLQPIVENAILHGIIPSHKTKKYIALKVLESNNQVTITIEDNGVGYHPKLDDTKKSMAIRNIKERISYLEKSHSIKINISISPLVPNESESGTIVCLQLTNL